MNGASIGGLQYLVRYPLSQTEAAALTLHRNGLEDLSGSVVWLATDIPLNGASTKIRRGESLLLTAGYGSTGTLVIAVSDADDQPYHSCTGTVGETFPVLFDQAGEFYAYATIDGISAGSLNITVDQVDLQGPIACEIGYRREKEVIINGPANEVFFTANDPALLEVSVKEYTALGARLYIKALAAGSPVLQARLGSATGPILAQQEIDEFVLDTQATMYIGVIETFPDGAQLLETNLEMFPKVEDLVVTLDIFIVGNTFEDSTLQKVVNTSDFVLDPVSGKYLLPYRIIRSPGAQGGGSPCHTIKIEQGSDQVGQ